MLSRGRTAVVGAVATTGLFVAFLPAPEGAAPGVMAALGLTVFTVGMWATGVLPEHWPSVAFFVLALVFGVAPPGVLLSSFTSHAFWLIAGGVVIGVAAGRTGLGRYLADGAVRRMGGSYARLIAGIVLGAVALAFLVPAAIARLIILMPIVLALADRLGFEEGSRGRVGMVLATTFASFFVPLAILPANLPNAVLAGVADQLFGIEITYGLYLAMHFPVTGVLKAVLIVVLICWMFSDDIPAAKALDAPPPGLSAEGKRLALITVLTLIAWATDFAHGVKPGWIAAVAGAVCLAPGIGVVRAGEFRHTQGLQTILFVAAVLALGNVIAATGAGAMIADLLLHLTEFPKGDSLHAYAAFSAIGMALCLFATLPGAIVVLAPFAGLVAEQSGVELMVVLMMLVNGYSTVFFPYQSGPILVGIRLGGAPLADATRATLALAVVTLLVLQPLNYFWWRLLGHLP